MDTTPTLGRLFAEVLRRNPSRVAIIDGDAKFTYAELRDRVGRVLAIFEARGIETGHRLGVALPMSVDFLTVYIAAHVAGVTFSDLSSLPAEAMAHRVAVAGIQTVLTEAGHAATTASAGPQFEAFEDWRDTLASVRPLDVVVGPAPEFAAINFSGGTTGKPKPEGVSGAASAALPVMFLASVVYPAMPVTVCYRTSAAVLAINVIPTLLRGGTVITLPTFDLEALIAMSKAYRADLLYLPTRSLYDLADHADVSDLRGRLQIVFHGGDYLAPVRAQQLVSEFGPILVQMYGCSETGTAAVLLPHELDLERPDRLQSVGTPLIGAEIEIRDENGRRAAADEFGEIVIRSPAAMSCYVDAPDATAETILDGWVHTGDVGRIDPEGFIYIADRISNTFRMDGRVIYPSAIDAQMCEHPAVSGSVTTGVRGESAEEHHAVIAVTLRPNSTAVAADLESYIVARARIRSHVVIMEEFPLLPAQLKIDRVKLRQLVAHVPFSRVSA